MIEEMHDYRKLHLSSGAPSLFVESGIRSGSVMIRSTAEFTAEFTS
jgi:hypothetical protein